jgi:hypothetical protein
MNSPSGLLGEAAWCTSLMRTKRPLDAQLVMRPAAASFLNAQMLASAQGLARLSSSNEQASTLTPAPLLTLAHPQSLHVSGMYVPNKYLCSFVECNGCTKTCKLGFPFATVPQFHRSFVQL